MPPTLGKQSLTLQSAISTLSSVTSKRTALANCTTLSQTYLTSTTYSVMPPS